jgi:SPP1 gp7 family putative phage head morphogenesis protein
MDVQYGMTGSFVFKAAVEFLKKKKSVSKEEFLKMDEASRAKAFMVSGYTKAEVLDSFLQALTEAVELGTTKEEFQKKMNTFLEENGYEGVNPFKADVIFQTNLQTAYNAGHYKSMTDDTAVKLRPFWQYRTAADGNVREEHAQMHGKVYRADDPIWDVWYPPNGFRCRCSVVSLSERQVKERGLTVETKPPRKVDWETGEILESRPDKGFATNPAKQVWEPDLTVLSTPVRKVFEKRKRKMPQILKNTTDGRMGAGKEDDSVITRYNAIRCGMKTEKSMENQIMYALEGLNVSEAPDEIKILPLGTVHSQKGDFVVDDESFDLINRHFENRGLDLVIDYEHQTLKDVQAPAGGWIKKLVKTNDAIAAQVEWTAKAKQYLENKEYKYLSPVVICRKSDGKAVALHSVALTNTPAIDGMFALVNSIDISSPDGAEGGNSMELKKIVALLGLPADATEADVEKAIQELKKQEKTEEVVANKTIMDLLELKGDAKTEDVAAKIMELKGTADKTKDEMILELKRRMDERDAEELVTMALKQGKISAAQKAWAKEYALKDAEGFQAFVAKAPAVVPIGKTGSAGYQKEETDTELDPKILKNLGVSMEDIKGSEE